MGFSDNIKHAWNIFTRRDSKRKNVEEYIDYGPASYSRPQAITSYRVTNEKSIITSIFNRLSIDVASNILRHVRLDENDKYKETMDSSLNDCFFYRSKY